MATEGTSGEGRLRRLVLIRHGRPELVGPDGTDASRRLTSDGVEQLRERFANELAPRLAGERQLAIWASPAVRAWQTARLAAQALGVDVDEMRECKALYDQDDSEFIAELEAMGEGTVIAVGHIPFMDRLCYELTGEDVSFLQGTICCIEAHASSSPRIRVAWTVGAHGQG